MSCLSVFVPGYPQQPLKILTHIEDISATLSEVGGAFIRERSAAISHDLDAQAILTSQESALESLADMFKLNHAYVVKPVESTPASAAKACLYYCIEGRVLVCIGVGEKLYAIECAKHDAVAIPANTPHWLKQDERAVVIALSDQSAPVKAVAANEFNCFDAVDFI